MTDPPLLLALHFRAHLFDRGVQNGVSPFQVPLDLVGRNALVRTKVTFYRFAVTVVDERVLLEIAPVFRFVTAQITFEDCRRVGGVVT